jgi:hypothetical protein
MWRSIFPTSLASASQPGDLNYVPKHPPLFFARFLSVIYPWSEYKAALNDSWAENYGLNAQPNGANIPLNLAAPTSVKFYYDHKSHWVTDNVNRIATAPGSYQSEIGCSGDWQPDCLRSWLQDPDGDGIYTFDDRDSGGQLRVQSHHQ